MEYLTEPGQRVLDFDTDLLTCEFDTCESLTMSLSGEEGLSNKQEVVKTGQSQTGGSFKGDLVLLVQLVCNNSYLSH